MDFSKKIAAADSKRTRERDYWLKKLSAGRGVVKSRFPCDFDFKTGTAGGCEELASLDFRLSDHQFALVMNLTGGSDVRVYIILAALLNLLTARYVDMYTSPGNGESDIIIGSPIARQEDASPLINTVLAFRNRFNDRMSVKDLLVSVRETIIEAVDHQNYPIELLPEQLNPGGSGPGFPLFDIVLLLENIHDKRYIRHIPVNMIFSFRRTPDAIEGLLEYNPRLYRQDTMAQAAERFKRIVENALEDPEKPLCDVDMVPEEEKKQVLVEFNRTDAPYPFDKTLHQLFEEQAGKTPDHVALTGPKLQITKYKIQTKYKSQITKNKQSSALRADFDAFGEMQLTYKELNEQSSRLAHLLIEKGVLADDIIGIMAERSIEMIIGMLGILKAGAAYMPIDPDYPQERIDYMLKDSRTKFLLTSLPEGHHFHYSSFIIHHSDHLAYVMYTSGTTGGPRGVLVTHRNVVHLVKNTNYVQLTERTRILRTGSPVFDAAAFEIWGSLLNGGQLVLIGKEVILNARQLGEALGRFDINTLWLSSSLFNRLSENDPGIFSPLAYLFVGGDVLSSSHINRVRKLFPGLVIINGYGSAENTALSAAYSIRQEFEHTIPIGRPIANSTAYIVDGNDRLQPIGIAGELVVGGDGVSRGYLNKPELTAEKFDRDLWDYRDYRDENYKKTFKQKFFRGSRGAILQKSPPGRRRLYKTGDLARWLPDGTIEFLGRTDRRALPEPGAVVAAVSAPPRSREASRARYSSIEPGEKREYYPLSPAQRRFYMMQEVAPETTAYNMPQVIPLGPGVDKEQIETACKKLIARHESLRTAIITVDDEPVQRIYDEVEFGIEYLVAKDAKDRESIIGDFIRPFDLSKVPPIRSGLIETADGNYTWVVDMHHIISDGTSQIVLTGDFVSLYSGEELGPIRLQYRDFSQWQNRMLAWESDRMKVDEAFWLEHLHGKLPVLNMPTDFPRPRDRDYAGKTFTRSLGRELSAGVYRLIRQTNTTLYMVLLTALNILLFRYTGQKDIIIGSLAAGRIHADLEKIIGLVMGGFMIRNFPSAEKTFRDFLQEVKERALAVLEHQAYPFEELLEKLDYKEIPGRHPISDVVLVVQNIFPGGLTGKQGNITQGEMMPGVSKMDLTLNVIEQGAEVLFIVEYRTSLFRRRSIERMLGHLANILKEATAHPGIRAGEIDVLTGDEKRELTGTEAPFFPLTHPQKRIFYTEKRYPRTTACLVTFTARYRRFPDKEIWQEAVNRVLQKNEALRIRIVECDRFNDPFQYIAPYVPYTPDTVDVYSPSDLAEWLDRKSREPFDLFNSNLFYFAYFNIDDRESGYYMKLHHIASDAGGALCLLNEIDEICNALEAGIPVDKEANSSYLRYIPEENEYLDSPQALEDKTFWHKYLLPLPGPIDLTSMSPGKASNMDMSMSIEARARLFVTADDVRNLIHRYCTENKISIFKVMLAALSVYISRLTGSDDFVIGTVNHNRPTREHWRITGMFASTIPLRIKIADRMSFGDLVKRTGKDLNRILKNHQKYPFDRLIEELREQTGMDPGYFLDVNLIDLPDVTGGKFALERNFFGAEPAPLTVHININSRDIQGILELEWDYQVKHFTAGDIERMHRGLVNILIDALTHPFKELWQIDWLSDSEKEQVIDLFNRSGNVDAEIFSPDKPLHVLFEEQAERTPERIAAVGKKEKIHIGYRVLNEKADQLAEVLKEKGVLADDIIGIMVERSIEMITGILGILKTGGAYLPIDPDYPQERIDFMLKDSNAKLLVTTNNLEVPDFPFLPAAGHRQPATSLAYVIYTSGSTGRPKGVAVTHRNVVAYLNAFDRQFALQPADIVVQQASYAFDAFVEEMYPVLLKGGVLAIPSKDEVVDIQRLVNFLTRHGVTVITCSPLMLSQLNQHPALPDTAIRTFISGGDRLKPEHIDNLLKIGRVFNTYGPTEATVCATYYRVAGSYGAPVPIGKPIPGYRVYILDAYLQPVPVGVNGELCIAGAGIARGYLNRPELTAERFVLVCYRSYRSYRTYISSKIIYKTGDRARWLADGNIEFTGRIDSQVKIRGYRIETGEIENRLLKHPGMKDVLVTAREENDGDLYLCAYVVCAGEVPELREYLAGQLPAYMVPAFFAAVDSIPLTVNGKPDLKALPDPLLKPGDDYEPPADRVEEELAALWSEVLNIPEDHIGVTANFFEIGGQSIKATKLTSKIHKHFNVKVPLAEIFNRPFVRGLAAYIRGAAVDTFTGIEKAEKKEYYALSSAQKRLYIVHQMEPDGIAYNVPVMVKLDREIDPRRLEGVFRSLVERHESFRTSFIEVEGEPVQGVHEPGEVEFALEYYDVTTIHHFVRPFDLSKTPLIRVGLVKEAQEKYTLMLDSHHIISDGASREILVREFMILYSGGQLPPLRLQYTDFSEWQNKLFVSGEIRKQEEYWLNRFKGVKGDIPVLNLPTDFSRETAVGEAGSRLRFPLEKDLAKRIKEISKETDTTLFMVFLAAYSLLLSKYSRQDDIVIGTGTTGRNHADLENIIGMFVNTLPLRVHIPPDFGFREFLNTVKKNVLEVFENEDFQYEELVNRLELERIPGRNPLFDCTYTFEKQDTPGNGNQSGASPAAPAAPRVPVPPNIYEHPAVKFDLLLKVIEAGGNLYLMLEYKTALFKESTVEEFKEHLIEILEQVAADSRISLADIKISHRLLAARTVILQEEDAEFDF